MRFRDDMSIRFQIALIPLVALLGFIMVIAFHAVSSSKLSREQEVNLAEVRGIDYLHRIQSGIMKARLYEKNFIASRSPAFAERHAKEINKIFPYIGKLNSIHPGQEDRAAIDELETLLVAYNEQFLDMAAEWNTIGLGEDKGVRGKLRNAVHSIERQIGEGAPALKVLMLEMRRREKDFIIRRDSKYFDMWEQAVVQFGARLNAPGASVGGKAVINKAFDVYVANFRRLVEELKDLTKDATIVDGIYEDLQSKMNSLAEKGSSDAAAAITRMMSVNANAFKLTETFTIIIGVVVIFMALLIGRGISKPLLAMIDAMRRLAKGDWDIAVPAHGYKNEIGDMAKAVDVFKQNSIERDRIDKELLEAIKAVEKALESEKEYNALQRQFVLMASHEFRTPLSIIDMTAQRIVRRIDTMTPEQIKERASKIRNAAKRMTGLVESTLNVAKIDEGKLGFSPERCDLGGIISECCELQADVSKEYEVTSDLDELPDEVFADPGHMSQILTNLLSNAVKYSPENKRIDVKGWTEDGHAVVSVSDHGVGIPESELPRMFSRFFRATTSEGISGTGIGLNLVKQLAEMQGGEIHLESVEGEGTTFTVRLPVDGPPGDQEEMPKVEGAA